MNALEYHPVNNLMLSGGLDKRIKLYNVNHTKSVSVQSIFIKDLPIYSAGFIQRGKEIIISGSRKHFYYYDMIKNELFKIGNVFGQNEQDLRKCVSSPNSPYFAFLGKENPKQVMMMSAQTKQLVFDLKISSGNLQDAAFSENSNYFYTADTSGSIQQFDLRTRTCVTTLADSGSFNTTCITLSNTGKYLATGNYAGVVNIYDLKHNDRLEGKPIKSIQNLTTAINVVKFNHNDEILAIGSKWKKNGLRLVHMDSLTVFENFPTFKNNVKYAFSCGFSHTSEFFSVGNDEGHTYLFALKHY